jgi:proline utilization trans-activator
VYSGLALRLSTCLGLHRTVAAISSSITAEGEHHVRLWWTVYCFDRSTSLRMGLPVSIDDADIGVRMPSYTGLPDHLKEIFDSPDHFCANIELSQIEGDITRNTNGLTKRDNTESFVNSVRVILTRLRRWDSKLPRKLRLSSGALDRPAASLQLHFNQCIILTTRPILLHVLRSKDPFSSSSEVSASSPMSATSTTLAESCISAARTSSKILSQLFVENSLATYGYFDAHNLFSSTLILIISAIISPSARDSDAVQVSFYLLKSMRDNGNTAASEYFERLAQIQCTVGRLRARSDVSHAAAPIPANDTNEPTSAAEIIDLENMQFEEFGWSYTFDLGQGSQDLDWVHGDTSVDPLSNPLLQSFLGQMDGSLEGERRPYG